jgi:hypothetical protein
MTSEFFAAQKSTITQMTSVTRLSLAKDVYDRHHMVDGRYRQFALVRVIGGCGWFDFLSVLLRQRQQMETTTMNCQTIGTLETKIIDNEFMSRRIVDLRK